MTNWSNTFLKIASQIDTTIDVAAFRFKLRTGLLDQIEIQPYRGHGTAEVLYLKGRVLDNKGITTASESDSDWENVVNMYRRFNSAEAPYAKVRARFQDGEYLVNADHEGFFDLHIEPTMPLDPAQPWHAIELELIEPQVAGQPPARATGHVLVPPAHATFGVISDIDDTIVVTGAADPIAMARIVVLNNPHTRLPFEGVAGFYQALRHGSSGNDYNPIFYVSSSPWNLYDLLIDFLNIHDIPLGPLFLRDIGLEEDRLLKSSHHDHKLKQIRTIVETHEDLPFILLGDSGQEDPEIYREAVAEHPGRIKAIYIRDVSASIRDQAIQQIATEVRKQGIIFELVADSMTAARHAAEHGFITEEALPKIQAQKAKEQQRPTLTEEVLKPLTGEQ